MQIYTNLFPPMNLPFTNFDILTNKDKIVTCNILSIRLMKKKVDSAFCMEKLKSTRLWYNDNA